MCQNSCPRSVSSRAAGAIASRGLSLHTLSLVWLGVAVGSAIAGTTVVVIFVAIVASVVYDAAHRIVGLLS